jgi:hypothetical protein
MAVHGTPADNEQGLNLPKSTGKVKYKGPEQDVSQPVPGGMQESTGAVKMDKTNLGKIENDAYTETAEDGTVKPAAKIEFPTPEGPTTMTSSWLSDAEAKVITDQHQADYKASVAEPKKSAKAETPAKPDAETKSETPARPEQEPKSSGRRVKDDDEDKDK